MDVTNIEGWNSSEHPVSYIIFCSALLNIRSREETKMSLCDETSHFVVTFRWILEVPVKLERSGAVTEPDDGLRGCWGWSFYSNGGCWRISKRGSRSAFEASKCRSEADWGWFGRRAQNLERGKSPLAGRPFLNISRFLGVLSDQLRLYVVFTIDYYY